jgi:chemotaxis protein CheX
MDANRVNPFLQAVVSVLEQFGINGIRRAGISVKENMAIDKEVTAFIGIVGEFRGNISYSFNTETARNLVSAMMMGMPVNTLDDMARSAVAELANMITGNAIQEFNVDHIAIDITPPSVVMGEEVYFILGTVTAISVNMETPAGVIEVNFGLES